MRPRRPLLPRVLALAALLACSGGVVAALGAPLAVTGQERSRAQARPAVPPPALPRRDTDAAKPRERDTGADESREERRREEPRRERPPSRALGTPTAGSLEGGVKLPARAEHFVSWDPILRRSPSRLWRRYGTGELVDTLREVTAGYARAHPGAARIAIGDLSRPRGGDFGPQYGIVGHASHQNGLDADVYFPRRDGCACPPAGPGDIHRERAQELVDRFVAAGAEQVLVGPATGLRGPAGVVRVAGGHDDHLHVRISDPR